MKLIHTWLNTSSDFETIYGFWVRNYRKSVGAYNLLDSYNIDQIAYYSRINHRYFNELNLRNSNDGIHRVDCLTTCEFEKVKEYYKSNGGIDLGYKPHA